MSYVNLINSLSPQQRLTWDLCVDIVKEKYKTIDVTDFNQVVYTKLVSSRYMLFDITRKMNDLEKKFNNGEKSKGYSLEQIEKTFSFYGLRK
jgi:hypothetical protein